MNSYFKIFISRDKITWIFLCFKNNIFVSANSDIIDICEETTPVGFWTDTIFMSSSGITVTESRDQHFCSEPRCLTLNAHVAAITVIVHEATQKDFTINLEGLHCSGVVGTGWNRLGCDVTLRSREHRYMAGG